MKSIGAITRELLQTAWREKARRIRENAPGSLGRLGENKPIQTLNRISIEAVGNCTNDRCFPGAVGPVERGNVFDGQVANPASVGLQLLRAAQPAKVSKLCTMGLECPAPVSAFKTVHCLCKIQRRARHGIAVETMASGRCAINEGGRRSDRTPAGGTGRCQKPAICILVERP